MPGARGRRAAGVSAPLDPAIVAPVCFVDTETTGLDPRKHPIWECALIMPNGVEHTWQLDLTPAELLLADPIALDICRFRERRATVGKRKHPSSFLEEFIALTEGLHLAGAIISFDEERLRNMAYRYPFIDPKWHYHIIDVEALAVGYIAGLASSWRSPERRQRRPIVRPPWKSDEITAELGIRIPEGDKHTAMGDARWAKAIYEHVMGAVE